MGKTSDVAENRSTGDQTLPQEIGQSSISSASQPRDRTVRGRVAAGLHQLARDKMLLVMLGGAVGCYLRYAVGKWCSDQPWGQVFPVGTLLINVGGCFVLAVAATIFQERLQPAYQDWYLLLGSGFCGGFTTFSTFGWETYKLIRDGSWWLALANVFGSVSAGLAGIVLGVAAVGLLFPRR